MKKFQKRIHLGLILAIFVVSTFVSIKNTEGFAPGGGGGGGNFTMTFYGYVKDSSGNILSGAKIVLKELEWGISKTVYSGSTGYYSVSISVYSYIRFTLTVSKSGYEDFSSNYYSPGTYRRDVYLNPINTHTFKCSGYVYQYDTSTKLSGVTVQMINPNGVVKATYTTGTSGYYYLSISTSDYANYKIKASKSGFESSHVYKYSNGIFSVNFYLKKEYSYGVSGCIRDDETINHLNATLRLYESGTLLQTVTTTDGYYSFSPVTIYSSTSFEVDVSSVGYSSESHTVSSGPTGGTTTLNCYLDKIKKFAVLVGVGDYWNDLSGLILSDLSGGNQDVVNWYNVLADVNFDAIWMFGDDNATTEFPSYTWAGLSTKAAVRAKVQYMASIADSNDIIMYHFFGHGMHSPWGIYDHQTAMLDYNIIAGYYDDDELESDISNTEAAKIIISDQSCTSGGIMDNFDTLADSDRYFIITACKAYETAWGNNLGGLFSRSLTIKWNDFHSVGLNPSFEDMFHHAIMSGLYDFPYDGGLLGLMTPLLFDGDLNNELYIHDY